MAQFRPRAPKIYNRQVSADFTLNTPTNEGSILYSILPSAVKSRLSHLPSLRRSVSMYGISGTRLTSASSSGPSTGSTTPDIGYTSAVMLSGKRGISGEEGYYTEISSDEDTAQTVVDARKCEHIENSGMELSENKSGIGWKFANQGLNLLGMAVEESSTLSHSPSLGNAPFARQLYVHALTYLLRGLPTDLTTEEQLSIRSAIPHGVVEPLYFEVQPPYTRTYSSDNQPSILHRTLASTIIQLFILVQFLLPYLKYWLQMAYKYDREHKILEMVARKGIETVDRVGRLGLEFGDTIAGIGDGRVGQMMRRMMKWLVEGVTGGIHEGLGEGMVIVGVVPRRESRP